MSEPFEVRLLYIKFS